MTSVYNSRRGLVNYRNFGLAEWLTCSVASCLAIVVRILGERSRPRLSVLTLNVRHFLI